MRRLVTLVTVAMLLCGTAFAQTGRGVVSGQIRLLDGAPAAGVRVSVMDAAAEANALTGTALSMVSLTQSDSDGRYRLEDIPPGRYILAAGPTFAQSYYPGARELANATAVTVTVGAVVTGMDFVLVRPPGLRVAGRIVRDPRQTGPMPKTIALNARLGEMARRDISADGSFDFGRVASGAYTLQVAAATPNLPSISKAIRVEEKDITDIAFAVPLTVPVSGRVTVSGGAPLPPGFRFGVSQPGGAVSLIELAAQPDGTFNAVLPEGEYHVVLSGLPVQYQVDSITDGRTDLLKKPLHLGFEESNQVAVHVTAPALWVKVRGRVEGLENLPQPESPARRPRVRLSPPAGPALNLDAEISADGAFEFANVLPGLYVLSTEPAPPPANGSPIDSAVFGGSSRTSFSVPSHDVDGVVLRVPALRSIAGRVSVSNGEPPKRFGILLTALPEEPGNAPMTLPADVGTDGTFVVRAPEGEYRAQIRELPPGYYEIKPMLRGSVDLSREPLRIGSQSQELTVTLGLSKPDSWATLRGRRALAVSTSFRPSGVSLRGQSVTLNAEAAFGSDGSFEFAGVAPGSYEILIPSGPTLAFDVPDKSSGPIDITIPTLRRIGVRIDVEGGAAAPLLQIAAASLSAVAGTDFKIVQQLQIQPNGNSVLTLPDGQYRIRLSGLPEEFYQLRSIGFKTANLLDGTLNISGDDAEPIVTALTAKPDGLWARLSGRVTGGATNVTKVVISGPTNLEAPVGADRSFQTPKLPPGAYTIRANTGTSSATALVAGKDVEGIELIAPAERQITGRVEVEDRGPAPSRVPIWLTPTNVSSFSEPFTAMFSVRPDGTFTARLPEGEYYFGLNTASGGIPPEYQLTAAAYASTDLLKEPVVINAGASELRLSFSVTKPVPWVKVSGRVSGRTRFPTTTRVVLADQRNGSTVESAIAPDGSFEFAKVLPGVYTARLNPTPDGALPVAVTVDGNDVSGVNLLVPQSKSINGQLIVDGGAPPLPRLSIALRNAAIPAATLNVNVQSNGSFTASFPEGEYQASITGLPAGYRVKAWTYGSKDLLRQPWKIAMNDGDSLRVTLDLAPAVSFVKVSGHVTGMAGGPNGAGQRVILSANSGLSGATMEATVAADGAFEFDKVLSGSYTLRPNPSPTGTTSLTIVVTDKDITDVNLVVPAQKRIAGQVVVEGGGPLPRFSIALTNVGVSGNRFTVSATTNAPDALSVTVPEGEYRASIVNLPEIYRLKALRYGAADLLKEPWKVAVADTDELRVTLELAPDVSLVKVSGHLTGGTSSNQRVTLSGAGLTARLSMEARVAPDGSFEFPKVPSGSYSARPVPAPAGVTAAAVTVAVTVADKDVSGINLVIPGQKRVTVRTVVEGGVLLPRFAIVLTGVGLPSTRTPTQVTNANATITVPEGEYHVSITGLPDSLQVKALTYGVADLLKQPWKVASADSAELRVTLARAPSVYMVKVTGRVTGLDGRAAVTRRVTLSGAAGAIDSPIAGDGSFGFANVAPGTYSLSVNQGVTTAGGRVPAMTVHVADRDIEGVELAIRRVAGTVKVEGDNPLPGLSIQFRSSDAENTTAVREDGTFVVVLLDGEYRIAASQLPAGYRVKSIRFADDPAGADLLSQPLTVSGAALPSIVIAVDAAGARAFTVSGHVSGMANLPPRTRRVILAPRPSGRSLDTPIAQDGSFEFAQVLPGRYVVRMSPAVPGVTEKEITVSDTNIAGVDFAIPGQKRLTIRAVVDEGGALPAFSLAIRPRTSTASAGTSSVSFRPASAAPQLTAAEGDFRVDITGVTAGYRAQSAMYGSVDTLKDGLRVTAADAVQEIVVTFSMTRAAFKVSGHVPGALPSLDGRGATALSPRVVLDRVGANRTANRTSVSSDALQAPIGAGGAFEFPKVPAGTYVLSLSPAVPGSGSKTITVDKDLTDVEIVSPGQRQIRGRVVVEGGGLLPRRLNLTLDRVPDGSRALSGALVIATDGSFTAGLPEGEYRALIAELPNTLRLKSWTYGSNDLLQQPLMLTAAASAEMLITLDLAAGVKTARVSGRVVNAEELGGTNRRVTLSPATATGAGGRFLPVAGSTLFPAAASSAPAAAINADGSFEFPRVLPGSYVLAAVPAPAGVTVSRSLTVTDRDLANIELTVPVSREVVMRMAVPKGIPGPRISMTWRGVADSSLTRPVSIDGTADPVAVSLPVGEYRLSVRTLPDSYELKSVMSGAVDLLKQTLKIDADSAPEVRVTVGVREKAAWFKVRGRVAGEDAAFSEVTLSGGYISLTARANSDGAFEFSTVPPGNYSIRLARVNQPLFLSPGTIMLNAVDFAALPVAFPAPLPSVSVTVADRDVDGVELKVPVERLLRVRVRFEGDAPWPRVSLNVVAARTGLAFNSQPRPDGTFSVLVTPGQYAFTLSAPEGYRLKSILYGARELGPTPLNIEENSPLDELTVTVEASAPIHWVRVKGRVTGLQGRVVAGASLLIAQPAGWEFEAPLNADGSFEFPRVRPGVYAALLLPNLDDAGARPITIGEAGTDRLEFGAPAVRQIRGRVVVEGGGPMTRVSLTLVSNASQSTQALIRAPEILIDPQRDGRFSIAVPEGVYRATVSVAAGGYRVRSLTLGSVDLMKDNLQAPAPGAAEMRITLAAPAALDWVKVSGKVSGMPQAGAGRPRVVKLDGPIPGLEGRIQPDGSFEIPRVLRGNYTAYVDAGSPGASARRIAVGRSDLTDVELTLRRPAPVSGRVKLDNGGRLPNLSRFTVSIADPDATPLNARLDSAARATPNASGTFQMVLYESVHRVAVSGIPPGYRVKSIVSGGTELTRGLLNLTAPAGAGRVEIEIVLTRN